jgi:heme A synthase
MAINVLWFLIGLIVLAGVVWLAIWVIESFIFPIPEQIKKGVWVIVLLLALIALISVLIGGGSFKLGSPFRGEFPGGAFAAISASPTRYLSRLLI